MSIKIYGFKSNYSGCDWIINTVCPKIIRRDRYLDFNLAGTVLAVRPYCNNEHYWQVYFDTNKVIKQTFGEAGYPFPEQRYAFSGNSEDGTKPFIGKS